MKRSIVISMALALVLFSCNNNDADTKAAEKDSYAKTKESLKDKEQKHPQDFIVVSGFNRKNMIGQTVIKGTVTSKSSVAVFQDINLKLSFYTKTHDLLETDQETVFEVLHPGESKDFKTKYFAPKGTDSVGIEVVGAKVTE